MSATTFMDIDPLSDNQPPPRHALESDSEDDEVLNVSSRKKEPFKAPEVRLVCSEHKQLVKGLNAIIVFGEVARHWEMVFEHGAGWKSVGSLSVSGNTVRIKVW